MTLSQSPKDPPQLSKEQAIRALWKKGIVRWKLDKNQLEMYDLIKKTDESIVVIGSSRQIGKSFCMCAIAIETCLKNYLNIKYFLN